MSDSSFCVSVIIPVYNAERFLERAVNSALLLPEVGEVILVDDAGPDQSIAVASRLEGSHERVRLLQHPDRANHGAGASRNLGIRAAKFPFIAFLDADDYYLQNRFSRESEIFGSADSASIDGVYGAIGIEYESDEAREQFRAAGFEWQEFLTVSKPVPADELINVLFHCHPSVEGEFHTNTITVRKALINKSGYFDESLRLRQDIHLWRRFAAVGNLVAGNIEEPVAIRGVHDSNRMIQRDQHEVYRDHWWESLREWFSNSPDVSSKARRIFARSYCVEQAKRQRLWKARWLFVKYVARTPSIIKEPVGYFDRLFYWLFGRSKFTAWLLRLKNRVSKGLQGRTSHQVQE